MAAQELFPKEVTTGVPHLTLTGMEKLHVEQHRGVVGYQPEEIVLRTSCGLIRVRGNNLLFRLYTGTEAVITGKITGISYDDGTGGGK